MAKLFGIAFLFFHDHINGLYLYEGGDASRSTDDDLPTMGENCIDPYVAPSRADIGDNDADSPVDLLLDKLHVMQSLADWASVSCLVAAS